eukprot:scaffold4.g4593.t1
MQRVLMSAALSQPAGIGARHPAPAPSPPPRRPAAAAAGPPPRAAAERAAKRLRTATRAAAAEGVEAIGGIRPEGKVRDTYDLGDKLVIVTTDRQSAFDRLLASVPFKGQNVITPTTKAEDHDEPISPAEIVAQGLMSEADWDAASSAALALFAFGQAAAAARGLLLVDTKYEFGKDAEGKGRGGGADVWGKDADGNVLLIDEIHTPDSSRYWLADTYEARHAAGAEPQNIDKEFLRLWFRANCDPYNDSVLPEAPAELVAELSRRYVLLYEKITGQPFQPAPLDEPPAQRMRRNIAAALERL